MLVAGMVAAAIVLLLLARAVVLPFILALFFCYLLLPVVDAMSEPGASKRSTPRPVAAFLALAACLGVLVVAILALGPILLTEANRLAQGVLGTGGHDPVVTRRVVGTLQAWRDALYGTGVFTPDMERQLNQEAHDALNSVSENIVDGLASSLLFFPKLLGLVAVPLLTFYMLSDGPGLARSVRRFLPARHQPAAAALAGRVHRVLLNYVRGQLATSLFIGVICAVGLSLLGLRMALLVAVVALVVEVIPFFGPLLWGGLATVLALVQAPPGSPLPLVVAGFAVVAQQVDSHLVAPLILGRFTRVHPLLLIFTTLLGAELFGLLGMFLAPVTTAVSKEMFLFIMERVQKGRTHERGVPARLRRAA